jgi:hypothetical protein
MVFFYNWPKIYRIGEANPTECFRIFKMLVRGEIPRSKYDPIYKYSDKNFSGQSFLINPEKLLQEAYKYKYYDLCIYIALAGIRSYADYKVYRITTLDLIKAPAHPHDYISNKSLLPVKDGKIHFLYEDIDNLGYSTEKSSN